MSLADFEKLECLLTPDGFECNCGRKHSAAPLKYLAIEPGAIKKLPEAVRKLGIKRPYVVMGSNGFRVAGQSTMALLDETGVNYLSTCIPAESGILPNEKYLEHADSAYTSECDFILGVGSGVINDLCKMLAVKHHVECGIIATAPSMDGYASNSSAMELDGIKTTVYTTCPSLILCDTEIMRGAPESMLRAGLGDMLAKTVSLADWRIASLVTGEYYCKYVADMMAKACSKVLENAQGLIRREETAVRAVTEGLILSGIAMSFAEVSRPASGMEHTISHILEMLALADGRRPAAHGLQVGYGLRIALELYKFADNYYPNKDTCIRAAYSYDDEAWQAGMNATFGKQAGELIARAEAEGLNTPEKTATRINEIFEHIEEIREIIRNLSDHAEEIMHALNIVNIPGINEPEELGYSVQEARSAVLHSRDLRDRYIFTSLCHDIAVSDETVSALLFGDSMV